MMKPSSPRFIKTPMGLDYSPAGFQERGGRNQRFNPQNDGDYALRWVALDGNNSASSRQLPQRQGWNVSWRQGADQSGYYSEDSELDSVSVTSMLASEASTNNGQQDKEQDGTFGHCLN